MGLPETTREVAIPRRLEPGAYRMNKSSVLEAVRLNRAPHVLWNLSTPQNAIRLVAYEVLRSFANRNGGALGRPAIGRTF